MAWSGSLAPRFVNNDYVTAELTESTVHACHGVYVTAEITYSTVHARHEVLAQSRDNLCGMLVWAPPRKRQPYCCDTAVSVGSAARGENIACLLLRLLHQPGERLYCVRLCYGCCCRRCASQEKIKVSAVLQVLESPSSQWSRALLTLGSKNSVHSEIQRDNWRSEQD